MILAFDIGNTVITIGGFSGENPDFVARLATDPSLTPDEYALRLRGVLQLRGVEPETVTGAILGSVVPPLSAVLRAAVALACGVTPLQVGPGVKTGLPIRCDDPASVGADLISAAAAVQQQFGGPAIIADLGTATNLILLDKTGAFAGGAIVPGAALALEALAAGTAQLPRVALETPRSAIGKNTVDCMRSGAVFGHAALLDGMIARFRSEIGGETPVYATGALADAILPHCATPVTHIPDLVLRGLYRIYRKNA